MTFIFIIFKCTDMVTILRLTFHIKLPGNFKLDEANEITAVFIKRIKSELNIFATIYIDSYTKTDQN
jgi:divalent metal cation (Fe/Co/Zn/Cd) transporter